MPIPTPTDHAAWRTRYDNPTLAMREALAYQAEAAVPMTWTLALLTKRMCRLWARCPCGLEKAIDMEALVAAGRGEQAASTLKLKCHECGAMGHPVLVWIGSGKNHQRCSLDLTTGEIKGSWRGAYPFRADQEALRVAFAELYASQPAPDAAD